MPNTRKRPTERHPSFRVTKSLAKRAFDVTFASLFLVVLFPAFFIIATAILLETDGPILVRIPKTGRNGQAFRLLNFRTLVHRKEKGSTRYARAGDYTRVGKLLHISSLEGMPQLINIITGDLSFVGPRLRAPDSEPPSLKCVQDYHLCLAVRPGLTGLAQVRGYYREPMGVEDLFTGLHYDIEYIKTWSLWLDLQTLLVAVRHALFRV